MLAFADREGSCTEAQRKMYLRRIANLQSPARRAERIAEVVRRCAAGRRLTDQPVT
jgi:hypothetical protein